MNESNREYHEVANIFPLLYGDEFDKLKADIAANGLLESIVIMPTGEILDGRNRHRACTETGVTPRFETWTGGDSFSELVQFVVSKNLHRRHLNSGQQAVIAIEATELVERLEREAKERQGARNDLLTSGKDFPEVDDAERPRDHLAQMFDTNPRYIQDAKKLQSEAPDLLADVRVGKKTLPKAKRELKERKREEEKTEAMKRVKVDHPEVDSRFSLFQSPISEACNLVDANSIDWVITDPPYPREYLPLFGDLARFCAHALKPGGSLICMTGQSYLPDAIRYLCSELTYHWTVSYLTPGGQSVQLWERKVNTFWKPLLWFVKGEYQGDWIGDVCKSAVNDNDKRFHGWGQSETGMMDILKRFTRPGDVVCDPFCGGGTTGVVSIALDRLFVGMDIDAGNIALTRERILCQKKK
jgi:site-specific DNA-methyltransferase (adenine-specific)